MDGSVVGYQEAVVNLAFVERLDMALFVDDKAT